MINRRNDGERRVVRGFVTFHGCFYKVPFSEFSLVNVERKEGYLFFTPLACEFSSEEDVLQYVLRDNEEH